MKYILLIQIQTIIIEAFLVRKSQYFRLKSSKRKVPDLPTRSCVAFGFDCIVFADGKSNCCESEGLFCTNGKCEQCTLEGEICGAKPCCKSSNCKLDKFGETMRCFYRNTEPTCLGKNSICVNEAIPAKYRLNCCEPLICKVNKCVYSCENDNLPCSEDSDCCSNFCFFDTETKSKFCAPESEKEKLKLREIDEPCETISSVYPKCKEGLKCLNNTCANCTDANRECKESAECCSQICGPSADGAKRICREKSDYICIQQEGICDFSSVDFVDEQIYIENMNLQTLDFAKDFPYEEDKVENKRKTLVANGQKPNLEENQNIKKRCCIGYCDKATSTCKKCFTLEESCDVDYICCSGKCGYNENGIKVCVMPGKDYCTSNINGKCEVEGKVPQCCGELICVSGRCKHCLDLNRLCKNDTDCCSGNCFWDPIKGRGLICRPPDQTCMKGGEPCLVDYDVDVPYKPKTCCSKNAQCVRGLCLVCQPDGAECHNNDECCNNKCKLSFDGVYRCLAKNAECVLPGGECDTIEPGKPMCCYEQAFCNDHICASCLKPGEACHSNGNCCSKRCAWDTKGEKVVCWRNDVPVCIGDGGNCEEEEGSFFLKRCCSNICDRGRCITKPVKDNKMPPEKKEALFGPKFPKEIENPYVHKPSTVPSNETEVSPEEPEDSTNTDVVEEGKTPEEINELTEEAIKEEMEENYEEKAMKKLGDLIRGGYPDEEIMRKLSELVKQWRLPPTFERKIQDNFDQIKERIQLGETTFGEPGEKPPLPAPQYNWESLKPPEIDEILRKLRALGLGTIEEVKSMNEETFEFQKPKLIKIGFPKPWLNSLQDLISRMKSLLAKITPKEPPKPEPKAQPFVPKSNGKLAPQDSPDAPKSIKQLPFGGKVPVSKWKSPEKIIRVQGYSDEMLESTIKRFNQTEKLEANLREQIGDPEKPKSQFETRIIADWNRIRGILKDLRSQISNLKYLKEVELKKAEEGRKKLEKLNAYFDNPLDKGKEAVENGQDSAKGLIDKGKEAVENGQDSAKGLIDKGKEAVENGQDSAKGLIDKGKEAVENGQDSAKGLIDKGKEAGGSIEDAILNENSQLAPDNKEEEPSILNNMVSTSESITNNAASNEPSNNEEEAEEEEEEGNEGESVSMSEDESTEEGDGEEKESDGVTSELGESSEDKGDNEEENSEEEEEGNDDSVDKLEGANSVFAKFQKSTRKRSKSTIFLSRSHNSKAKSPNDDGKDKSDQSNDGSSQGKNDGSDQSNDGSSQGKNDGSDQSNDGSSQGKNDGSD